MARYPEYADICSMEDYDRLYSLVTWVLFKSGKNGLEVGVYNFGHHDHIH
jgi:hypothetical protein